MHLQPTRFRPRMRLAKGDLVRHYAREYAVQWLKHQRKLKEQAKREAGIYTFGSQFAGKVVVLSTPVSDATGHAVMPNQDDRTFLASCGVKL